MIIVSYFCGLCSYLFCYGTATYIANQCPCFNFSSTRTIKEFY